MDRLLKLNLLQLYRGGPNGQRKEEAPHINKDPGPMSSFVLFYLKLCSCWWKRLTCITTIIWTNPSAWCDYIRNAPVSIYYFADEA
jgi:hypothetical protein